MLNIFFPFISGVISLTYIIFSTFYLKSFGKIKDTLILVYALLIIIGITLITQNWTLTNVLLLFILGFFICFLIEAQIKFFEFSILMAMLLITMIVVTEENNLLTIFLALEIQGMCLYALMGSMVDVNIHIEAALKYYILSTLATISFLYGFLYLYANFITVNLVEISNMIMETDLVMKLGLFFF